MSTSGLYLRQWRLKLSEGKTVSTVFHLNNKEAKRDLGVYISTRRLNFQPTTTYIGVKFDRTLSYRQHLAGLRDKVMARSALIRKLVGTAWGASPSTLHTSELALVYAPAEYCAPTWSRSRHTSLLDVRLNCTPRIITGSLQPTPVEQLPALCLHVSHQQSFVGKQQVWHWSAMPWTQINSSTTPSPGKRRNLDQSPGAPFATSGKDQPTQWERGPPDS